MKVRNLILAACLSVLCVGCRQQDKESTNVEIGMEAIEDEYYQNALESFQAAITEEKRLVEAYRGEGLAYMGMGQYENAVSSFDKALGETDEKMTDAIKDIRYYKAAALYKMDNYVGTISVCDDILKLAAEGDAYYLRGTCYLEQGETDKAKVDFDAAVKDQPKDYELYLNIYESYKEKKLSAQGDTYLQKALEIESTAGEDAYQKARIYYFLENYEQAQAELTALVNEQEEKSLLLMGQIYQAQADYLHARNMYEQYISVYGETPEAYNGIVLADIGEQNYDSALAGIDKGIALDQEKGKQELYYNQIVAYEYKHDFDTAQVKAQEYVTRYPADKAGLKEYEFLQSR